MNKAEIQLKAYLDANDSDEVDAGLEFWLWGSDAPLGLVDCQSARMVGPGGRVAKTRLVHFPGSRKKNRRSEQRESGSLFLRVPLQNARVMSLICPLRCHSILQNS